MDEKKEVEWGGFSTIEVILSVLVSATIENFLPKKWNQTWIVALQINFTSPVSWDSNRR